MAILESLRLILENTHNAYMFQMRCKQHQIIIEQLPDNSILAYRADDRDDKVAIDTTIEPFNKIIRF